MICLECGSNLRVTKKTITVNVGFENLNLEVDIGLCPECKKEWLLTDLAFDGETLFIGTEDGEIKNWS